MPTLAKVSPVVHSHNQTELDELVEAQRRFYAEGYTRSYKFRKGQLQVLKQALLRHEQALRKAIHADLRKDEFEFFASEFGQLLEEISYTQKNLKAWIQPEPVSMPIIFWPSSGSKHPEPRGNTLIIAPWNYPLLLLLRPLISAIAAGCTAILKPSEEAAHTAEAIRHMMEETFEPEYISVVLGEGAYIHECLNMRHYFGLVFFTGSPRVGSLVMHAASKHLSPVVLELGGKSPAVVAPDAPLDYAAKRIIFTKWMNLGQTCVAADYVLVHEAKADVLIQRIRQHLVDMYGENPQQSPHLGRIINQRQLTRLVSYLNDAPIVHGGQYDVEDLFIAPTLVLNPPPGHPLMENEIFGPILPIVTYSHREEALEIIQRHPNPLAFYLFTNHKETERFYLDRVSFGGGCINNGIVHLGSPELPFGGVGNSGMGSYVGRAGFDSFTHYKSMVRSKSWFDTPVWYAPRKAWYMQLLRRMLR